jgi:hypothetical protein
MSSPRGIGSGPPEVTGVPAAGYLMQWMDAAREGRGVNARRLAADALAAEREKWLS